MSDASEPRRRRVGAVSEKRKKEKEKGHRWTPESGASSPFRCPTHVGRGHDAKNGVSVQPSCDHAEFPASMSLVFNFSFDLRIFLPRGLNKTMRKEEILPCMIISYWYDL